MADRAQVAGIGSAAPALRLRAVLALLRPGDWLKNIFVFIPIVFWLAGAGRSTPTDEALVKCLDAAIAFAAFCFVASGFYCINDALDVDEDRTHPVKQRRPVASGAVSVRLALTLGPLLVLASLALALTVSVGLLGILVFYALLQVAYNIRLKRTPFVDVATIALGFVLRAIGGGVAVEVPVSIWLVLCVFFLTLYLGFIKRLCDLASAENARRAGVQVSWHPRAGYESRDELNWLLAVGGVMTILMYLMYSLSEHAKTLFGVRAAGFALLSPFVVVVIHRFYRRSNLGLSDSPLDILTQDRTVLVAVLCFVSGTLATLFVPQVAAFLQSQLYF